MNWRAAFDGLPKPPEPPRTGEPSGAAPASPRVEPAKSEPKKIDNTDPSYWSTPASPAEIAKAEAYRDALERRAEAEERRLRALERAGRRERQS